MLSAEEVKAAAKVAFQGVRDRFGGQLVFYCNGCGGGNHLNTNIVKPEHVHMHNTYSDFEAAMFKNTQCPNCKCKTSLVKISYATSWIDFYNEARQALKAKVDHKTAVKEHATRRIFGLVCLTPFPVYTDMPSIPAAREIKTIHHAEEWDGVA